MRSGGSVLEAPQALKRGHSPASIVRKPVVRNCAASIVRRANLTYSASVKLNFDGVADMRSGGSVLEAPPGAEEGALPREHCPQAVSRTLPAQTYKGIEKALRYFGEPFLYVQLNLTA